MVKISKRAIGIVAAAWLCLLCTAPMANAIMVRLELSTSVISVGTSFDMEVFVDDVYRSDDTPDEIIAFGFDLDYDDTAFLSTGATVADPFMDDSARFPDTDVAGSIDFLDIGPGGNDILLATLGFTALEAGDYSLGIVSDLFDLNEGLLTFWEGQFDLTSSIDVTVAAASVPEPGTVVLMLVGLGGLGLLKRRRS
jgi:hypothetical protein